MYFPDAVKNSMLDVLDETGGAAALAYASLHSAYSTTGANAIAATRVAATWAAASAGSKAISAALTFTDVPAGADVAWIGFWSALTAGTFRGMLPAAGGALKGFAVDDLTADTLKSEAHGFANGDTVVVWGPQIPSNLAVGTIYYVVSSATDTLQLSATSGGAAINFSDKGQGFLQKIVVEHYSGAGQYQVPTLTVDLGAVA